MADAVTIITTCRGRLEHAAETVPLMLEQAGRVVFVDWACPDQSGKELAAAHRDSVATGALVIVERPDAPELWNASAARNAGAARALELGAEVLWFVDADTRLHEGAGAALAELVAPRRFVIAGKRGALDVPDLIGMLGVDASDFQRVGGYDEGFAGLSCEDMDLRVRLAQGSTWARLPLCYLDPIEHPDELRARYAPARTGGADRLRARHPRMPTRARSLCGRFGGKAWVRV